MVLEKLGSSLKDTLSKIAKAMFVDDKLINELVKDIQRALLQADVNVKLVFDLTNNIRERIKAEKDVKGLTKKEQLINVVYEELVNFLGKEAYKIEIKEKPFKIMLVGLFGSGKTTTSGKLARFFTKRGYKVALLGLDIHRPAAMDQIEQIAAQVHVPVYLNKVEKDPIKIWNQYKDEYKKYDVLIIDTAGRDALSKDLIKEIESINKEIKPNENLLVISADIGQAAQKQAQQFHDSCHVTGVIATKMDGTAKAGGALSACAVTQAPIKFIGVGEKLDDLEQFNPQGFVGRLLGMGDLEALLEKAKEAITEEQAEDLGKKLLKGDFTLIDLYEQMEAMSKMGPLSKIMEMIPGFGQIKMPKEALQVQEEKLKKWKIAMNSMTKEELEEPEIISGTRIERIAKGSGLTTGTVKELIKQYNQSKKMIKMMKGSGDINKMMKKMQGKLPPGFGM
ncbi:MAG: signal recognition particle protein Srp54 [Nanoarchaeota archaeon]|nr:signal recognition particle protein Srp54 [Nanoarchaeota archaeon]MBU1005670.1 signal recognition particle protein Srp54 [Nanoarchaeota archaeon]MBU1946905.1 signal recognition particle protein Srp54 [Nanoarchaeota archaeon]